jgi:hypothetical protein
MKHLAPELYDPPFAEEVSTFTFKKGFFFLFSFFFLKSFRRQKVDTMQIGNEEVVSFPLGEGLRQETKGLLLPER